MKLKLPAPNPVTVKELRQNVRSRIVSTGLVGFLFIQVAAVAIALVAGRGDDGDSLYGEALGKAVFGTVMSLLGMVVFVAIPFFIASRMTAERKPERMDLQFTTALTPMQFVDGKIMSAIVLMVLFASTSLPFLMLAYLLRGVDMFSMLGTFLAMAVGAVCVYYLALLFATVKISKAFRIIVALIAIQLTVYMATAIITLAFAFGGAAGVSAGWKGVAFTLLGATTACLLMRSMAAANISPPSSNSARGFRRLAAIFWFVWMVVAGVAALYESEAAYILAWGVPSILVANVLMFIAVSSKPGCSRRVLMEVSPRRWRRLAQFPFFTGAENGIVFAVVLGIATLAVCAGVGALDGFGSSDFVEGVYVAAILFLYPSAFFVTARLLWQFGLRKIMNHNHVGLVGLLLMFLASLLPFLLSLPHSLDSDSPARFAPGNMIAALVAAEEISKDGDAAAFHIFVAIVWLAIALILAGPALFRAFSDFKAPAQRRAPPQTNPTPEQAEKA